MRAHIVELVAQALGYLKRDGELVMDPDVDIQVEQTRDSSHGDYACNIAMILAKPLGKKPRDLAEADQGALAGLKAGRQGRNRRSRISEFLCQPALSPGGSARGAGSRRPLRLSG